MPGRLFYSVSPASATAAIAAAVIAAGAVSAVRVASKVSESARAMRPAAMSMIVKTAMLAAIVATGASMMMLMISSVGIVRGRRASVLWTFDEVWIG
ncbi:lipoprotein-anchoring transpeptidase ErfK/SrfK [Paenibacillus forsythiae]|uniref:Lipoprotein-anchoring transpeptidase ErfK/SrfK n=1 Tax=Paenibacillus forsythiae TaxID=365616 RepID=A0ABU3H232_9BACL|nr:hypothetical protein [Paenibacillus forsythiae]MDT3424884.1 lipoprotein-anchoring transpeptidase ErfK/SrfK [Paenibacillus forsythiae]